MDHSGKSLEKPEPPVSCPVRPGAGAEVAPMTVGVVEAVLLPEPQWEAEAIGAGRYGGQGYAHWNEISHSWGQSSQKIASVVWVPKRGVGKAG